MVLESRHMDAAPLKPCQATNRLSAATDARVDSRFLLASRPRGCVSFNCPVSVFFLFVDVLLKSSVFAGHQVGARDEEGRGVFDSIHGEGEGGVDVAILSGSGQSMGMEVGPKGPSECSVFPEGRGLVLKNAN